MNSLPKWLVTGLGGLLIAFVALLVAGKAKELGDLLRNKKPQNTISVSAEGKVQAIPDLATVNLGVLTQGDSPSKVQEDNSQKVNKIIDYIKQQGINKDDISTSQFNIYPQYDYSNGKNNIIGYQLNQTITVKVRGMDKGTDALGKILEGAVKQGANEINGVSLSFDDPDDLRQEARKMAIEKAKAKAQDLAQAAGLKLGKVVSVSESGMGGYPVPMYADSAMGYGAGGAEIKAAAPNIEPGSQDVIANMTVVFEVK